MNVAGGRVITLNETPSQASGAAEGFLLLDASLNPTFVNRVAAQILSYPQKLEAHKNLDAFLAGRVRTLLVSNETRVPTLVAEFQSGKRRYKCRAYRINALAQGDSQGSLAVILERVSNRSFSVAQASDRYNLTVRERQVLQHLSTGLTTKEIASGMDISPNTVKAFLRMIMVKMGVSTRSGIVGKALTPRL